MALSRRSIFYVTEDRNLNENVLLLTVNGDATEDQIRAVRRFVMDLRGEEGLVEQMLDWTDTQVAEKITRLLRLAGHDAHVANLPVLGALHAP